MMSLRELVACASPLSGSHTVRDHLAATDCLSLGGSIIINGEIVEITAENSIMLLEINNNIQVIEEDNITIEEVILPISIDQIIEDEIDGIC